MSAQSAIYNPTQTTSAATGDGFSVPRLTTTGRLAITFTTADKGMMVYDTTLENLFIWDGSAWESVPASGDSSDQQVIFNDGGILAGDSGLLYDKTLKRLIVAGNLRISRGLLNQGTSTAVGDDTLDVTVFGANANTAVGYRAASQLLSGSLNTAVGYLALKGALGAFTGSGNVGVGANAGASLSSGSNNIAVGTNALLSTNLITGTDNIGIGRDTFLSLTGGTNGIAIGLNSSKPVTAGNANVSIGPDSYNCSTAGLFHTGSYNIAVGPGAMFSSNAISGQDNIAIGRDAMRVLSNGLSNVCIGLSSGFQVTGSANTFLGANSGANVRGGNYNIGIGPEALNSAAAAGVTGSDNIGLGRDTFRKLSTGVDNIAIGRLAGTNLTSGAYNIAIGLETLRDTVTGSDNIAIGDNCLVKTTTSNTVAIGTGALQNQTTGIQNVGVGRSALQVNVTGNNNAALGFNAAALTVGNSNTAIGALALAGAATGNNNTAIGHNTLSNAGLVGSSNTALGVSSGFSITSGSSNIVIGVDATTETATSSNQLSFGSAAFFVGTNAAANTYYATAVTGTVAPPAGATGFWRVIINGTPRKIAVYAD